VENRVPTVANNRKLQNFGAAPGHEFSMALRRAYMRLHRDTCARCAEEDITADQYVMMNVIKSVGTAKQSELVVLIDSDANTVSAMLRRLQKRGLIKREAHTADLRAKSVGLTKAGTELLAVLEEKTAKNRKEMEAAFSKSELSQLILLLRRLATM
jgi:DNA-binding MarR family transcriptional regulator